MEWDNIKNFRVSKRVFDKIVRGEKSFKTLCGENINVMKRLDSVLLHCLVSGTERSVCRFYWSKQKYSTEGCVATKLFDGSLRLFTQKCEIRYCHNAYYKHERGLIELLVEFGSSHRRQVYSCTHIEKDVCMKTLDCKESGIKIANKNKRFDDFFMKIDLRSMTLQNELGKRLLAKNFHFVPVDDFQFENFEDVKTSLMINARKHFENCKIIADKITELEDSIRKLSKMKNSLIEERRKILKSI